MENEELFSKTRWPVLKELAKKGKSAVDIAKAVKQSTANITTQLKVLEAQGAIKKVKDLNQKKYVGKPKQMFELNQEHCLIGVLKQGFAEKRTLKLKDLTDIQKFMLNTYFMEAENQEAIIKFICQTDILDDCELISFIKNNENEIELFLVSETKLDHIREKHSNMNIKISGQTKKIISWSHNIQEVEEGLLNRDEYFKNLVESSKELLDKQNLLAKWKNKQ